MKDRIRISMNVIDLSNLYSLSLDDLLKGDDKMIEHLEKIRIS